MERRGNFPNPFIFGYSGMLLFWFTISLLGLTVEATAEDYLLRESYKASTVWIAFSGLLLSVAIVVCAWKDCWKRRSGHEVFENDITCELPSASQREFTIFAPLASEHSKCASQVIEFEVLPEIRPRKNICFSYIKPAGLHNTVARGGLAKDWFEEPYCSFPRDQLHYIKLLGKGWFGQVIEAEAQGIIPGQKKSLVVVKVLQEGASYIDQMCFLHEVKVYKDLFHPNILKLLGCCLQTEPYLLILEYCYLEDLKSYLLSDINRSKELLQSGVILRMLCEVATALHYMHKHGFVHNDLAARNCLVSDKLSIKIGDYGCGIERYQGEYYYAVDAAIPVRWCSPSSLSCTSNTIETKEVTVKDNVWTFGVLMWETLTLGKLPYFNFSDEEVIQKVIIDNSVLLPPVPTLDSVLKVTHSDSLYNVMLGCWKPEANRVDLELISQCLDRIRKQWSSEQISIHFEDKWNSTLSCCTASLSGTFVPSSLMFESDFCGMNHGSLSSNESEHFLGSQMVYRDMLSASLNNLKVSLEDMMLTPSEVSANRQNVMNVVGACESGKESAIKLDRPLEFRLGSFESPGTIGPFDYANKLNRDPLNLKSSKESTGENANQKGCSKDESYSNDIIKRVQQKSKSIQNLFRLTHMGASDNSDNESNFEETNKHSLVYSSEGSLHTLDLSSRLKKEEQSCAQEFSIKFDNLQVKQVASNHRNVNSTHEIADKYSGINDAPLCMPKPSVLCSALSKSNDHIPSALTGLVSTSHNCTQELPAYREFDCCQNTSLDSDDLKFFSSKSLNDLTLCDFRSTPNSTSVCCQTGLNHNSEISSLVVQNPNVREVESQCEVKSQEQLQISSSVNACNSDLTNDYTYQPRVIFGPCDDFGLDYYQSIVSHTPGCNNDGSGQPSYNDVPENNFPELDSEMSTNNSWEIIRSDDSLTIQRNVGEGSKNCGSTDLSSKPLEPDKNFGYMTPCNDSTSVPVCEHKAHADYAPHEIDSCEEAKELLNVQHAESYYELNGSECEMLRRESDLLSIRKQLQLILPDFSSQIPSFSSEFHFPSNEPVFNDEDQLSELQMSLSCKPLEGQPTLLSPIVEMSEESSLNSSCDNSSNSSDTTHFSDSSPEEQYGDLFAEDILHQLPYAGLSFNEVCNPTANLYFETIDYSVDDYLLVDTETNEAVLVPIEHSQGKPDEFTSAPISSDKFSLVSQTHRMDFCEEDPQESYKVDSTDDEFSAKLLTNETNVVECEKHAPKDLQCRQESSHRRAIDKLSLQVFENDTKQCTSAHMENLWECSIPDCGTVCYNCNKSSHLIHVGKSHYLSPVLNSNVMSGDDSSSQVEGNPLQKLSLYTPDLQNNSEDDSGGISSSQSLSSSEEHIYFVDSNMVGTEESKSSQWDSTLLPIRSSLKSSLEEKR